MNKPDKSIDCPESNVELITPFQIVPLIDTIHGNSTFTTELATNLCEYIENGGNLSSFIRQCTIKLSHSTIYTWLDKHDKFKERFNQATLKRSEYRAETLDSLNQQVLDGTLSPGAAKVISSNQQWVAARENPKKYGEASLVKLANSEGGELGIVGMLAQITE